MSVASNATVASDYTVSVTNGDGGTASNRPRRFRVRPPPPTPRSSFWSADTDNGAGAPSSSASFITAPSLSYLHAVGGSAAVHGGGGTSSTVNLTQNNAKHWGTIAAEINHS